MAGVHQHSPSEAGFVERLNGLPVEANSFVARQDGLMLAAITARDALIAFAKGCWNIRDLKTPGLARMRGAAQGVESPQEKRSHEIGLKAARFGSIHLFLHREKFVRTQRLLGEGTAIQQRFQMVVVECLVDLRRQARPDIRAIAVADSLHQEVFEACLLEHLAEDVKDAALQGRTLNLQLLEQTMVDIALAGFPGDKVHRWHTSD